jgi:hypothetical protein
MRLKIVFTQHIFQHDRKDHQAICDSIAKTFFRGDSVGKGKMAMV